MRVTTLAVGAFLSWGVAAGQASADARWLEVGGERSAVSIGESVWWGGRVEAAIRREGRGGASLSVENIERFGRRDIALGAAAHRFAGEWTASGRVGFTPGADFSPALTLEAELARRAVGTWVLHGGYRLLRYPTTTVHVLSPAATWYGPRAELHVRGYASRNVNSGTSGGAVLLRASWQAGARVRLTAGVSRGTRLFDFVPSDRPAPGYVVFAGAQLRATARDTVGIDLRVAGEKPAFRQRTLGLSYRRAF